MRPAAGLLSSAAVGPVARFVVVPGVAAVGFAGQVSDLEAVLGFVAQGSAGDHLVPAGDQVAGQAVAVVDRLAGAAGAAVAVEVAVAAELAAVEPEPGLEPAAVAVAGLVLELAAGPA